MSKAFSCDRCGECFTPFGMDQNEFFVSIPQFYKQSRQSYIDNKTDVRFEDEHLCPKCSVIFMQFMYGREFVEKVYLTTLQEDYDALKRTIDEEVLKYHEDKRQKIIGCDIDGGQFIDMPGPLDGEG